LENDTVETKSKHQKVMVDGVEGGSQIKQAQSRDMTKLFNGAEMAIFGVIFESCISSDLRAPHFRHAF